MDIFIGVSAITTEVEAGEVGVGDESLVAMDISREIRGFVALPQILGYRLADLLTRVVGSS